MEADLLRFPHKHIRALYIKKYMDGAYDKAVCFSCGHAADELKFIGVDVLHIGPKGDLTPNKWFTPKDIKTAFPSYFDATSGHLPMDLMMTIGNAYKLYLGDLPATVHVPCGSGETLVCLKMAYPDVHFIAHYNLDDATAYDPDCVLNRMVELLADKIIMGGDPDGKETQRDK